MGYEGRGVAGEAPASPAYRWGLNRRRRGYREHWKGSPRDHGSIRGKAGAEPIRWSCILLTLCDEEKV